MLPQKFRSLDLFVLLCAMFFCAADLQAAQRILFAVDGQAQPAPVPRVATQDAQLQWKEDRLFITTGPQADWPGITIQAPDDAWDLSSFLYLVAKVRNTSEQSITICCRVDNPGADGRQHCLNGRLNLPAAQSGSLVIPLWKKMPAALRSKLFGMRGYPDLWHEQQGIDLRQVTQLLLFFDRPRETGQFELLEVRATGQRGPAVPTTEHELFPMIDQFGQFRHKTWPGKTLSEADLRQHRVAEQADLQAHPSPADWNTFGGWQRGPSLEATGRFYTTQHQGRWWLVDPDGRLFWSHGIDCVRATSGYTPISDREHWFADLPARDSRFGSFYGRGRWAPHGYYADKAEYDTYNFTAANLSSKYGQDWPNTFAQLCHQRLRSWGLNTIANWSDRDICRRRQTPYTANVGFNSVKLAGSEGYWGKFPDVFDDRFRRTPAARYGRPP